MQPSANATIRVESHPIWPNSLWRQSCNEDIGGVIYKEISIAWEPVNHSLNQAWNLPVSIVHC